MSARVGRDRHRHLWPGAIIYEMLVGRPPFGGSSRHETICQVVAGDIVAPSRLRPQVPRDLETICLKCLERDPAARYPTATDLAEELERFLEGRPIKARRARAWERGLRWCHRKPIEAALLVALALVLLTSFASVTWLWRRANGEAIRANAEADRASKASNAEFAARTAESRLRIDAQAEIAARDLDQGIAAARRGNIDQGLLWMAQSARKAPAERPELLRAAQANLSAWSDCTIPLRALLEHRAWVGQALFRRDGKAVLTGSRDGTAQLWETSTGRRLAPPINHGDQIMCVAISADGRRAATGGTDGKVIVWDAATSRAVGPAYSHPHQVHTVEFSPDGRLLMARSLENNAWL